MMPDVIGAMGCRVIVVFSYVKTLSGLVVHDMCQGNNCGLKGQWFRDLVVQGRLQWGVSVCNGRVKEKAVETWIRQESNEDKTKENYCY